MNSKPPFLPSSNPLRKSRRLPSKEIMKIHSRPPRFLVPLILFVCLGSRAAAAVTVISGSLNQAIPDGSPLGFSDTRTIGPGSDEIVQVKVRLHVTGGFNGDLYIQLIHGSGVSILMNRVGRTASNEFGYGDSGFNIEFADDAAAGDVHAYRTSLFGNESTTLVGALSGTWAPDGRLADPGAVIDSTPRSALLSTFIGQNPQGSWTLFVADMEGGGVSTLQSWDLEISAVPEPNSLALVSAGLLVAVLRRRRMQR